MGGCSVTFCAPLPSFFFFFFNRIDRLFVHFFVLNEKPRPNPVIKRPGVFIVWWGSSSSSSSTCPLCISGKLGEGAAVFSHTLRARRTLKCYLMLAGEHMDTAGVFLRRAFESMHNNFAIYCGLVMVHGRCYIGLECTILFFARKPLSGLWATTATGPLAIFWTTKHVDWLQTTQSELPFWRRTFLRRLCQHAYDATFFFFFLRKVKIWLTERTLNFTTVFS